MMISFKTSIPIIKIIYLCIYIYIGIIGIRKYKEKLICRLQ